VLTSLGVTEQHDWFTGVQVVPAGQLTEGGWCYVGSSILTGQSA
jgi:hypothetical protein